MTGWCRYARASLPAPLLLLRRAACVMARPCAAHPAGTTALFCCCHIAAAAAIAQLQPAVARSSHRPSRAHAGGRHTVVSTREQRGLLPRVVCAGALICLGAFELSACSGRSTRILHRRQRPTRGRALLLLLLARARQGGVRVAPRRRALCGTWQVARSISCAAARTAHHTTNWLSAGRGLPFRVLLSMRLVVFTAPALSRNARAVRHRAPPAWPSCACPAELLPRSAFACFLLASALVSCCTIPIARR